MADRFELDENFVELIAGGKISYNYNQDGSVTCGINDPNQYKVHDYSAFKRIVKENYGTLSDKEIISLLKSKHVIG